MTGSTTATPLAGTRVLELAGQGPGPFACMLLADLGAEVVTVERIGSRRPTQDAHWRGRSPLSVDVKDPRGRDLVLQLVERSDVLVEGFRPGVVERLGLSPEVCLGRNPRLVFARITGWGQDGPLAQSAGHDINYLALSGALELIGTAASGPVAPLNLLADYGAGGFLLVCGVLAALLERTRSGQGQVVDAAMVDGLAAMMAPFHAMTAAAAWQPQRGTNMLDGGAHFYGTYQTSDDKWLAVGAIEQGFYDELVAELQLPSENREERFDSGTWPSSRARLAAVFATRTQKEWEERFASRDACVHPVLSPFEARRHEHAEARAMFADQEGVPHQAPAPRFSRSPLGPAGRVAPPGSATDRVLRGAGLSSDAVGALRAQGVVA